MSNTADVTRLRPRRPQRPTIRANRKSATIRRSRSRVRPRMGVNPHPSPTKDNPARWDCGCGHLWRILTVEQVTALAFNPTSGSACVFWPQRR